MSFEWLVCACFALVWIVAGNADAAVVFIAAMFVLQRIERQKRP